MTHFPNKFDVITDLRRCLAASYSDLVFDDKNVKVFLQKAEKNLEILKESIGEETIALVKKRIEKAKDGSNLTKRRREDLLMASCLLVEEV